MSGEPRWSQKSAAIERERIQAYWYSVYQRIRLGSVDQELHNPPKQLFSLL